MTLVERGRLGDVSRHRARLPCRARRGDGRGAAWPRAPFSADEPLGSSSSDRATACSPKPLLTRFPRGVVDGARRFGIDARRSDAAALRGVRRPRARRRLRPRRRSTGGIGCSASDLVVSSLALHHLNDAKKQYLYKAAADRLTARGALLVADLVEPTAPGGAPIGRRSLGRAARGGRPRRSERRNCLQRFARRALEPLPVSGCIATSRRR